MFFQKGIVLLIGLALLASCSSRRKVVRVPIKKEKSEEIKNKKEINEEEKTHWSYQGEKGPDQWALLDPKYVACGDGQKQSPINLVWQQPIRKIPIPFFYKEGGFELENNGHALQVNIPAGNKATFQGQIYELAQIHFHAASEHTVSGKRYPLEAHFVHRSLTGDLAVVSVLFEIGQKNLEIEKVIEALPLATGEKKQVGERLDPQSLMPKTRTHYQYSGSLTTPPCSEGVLWTVFNTSNYLSKEQLGKFQEMYSGNFRPLQPLNGRKVINY